MAPRLTQRLSRQHPTVLTDHSPPGVSLAGVLDEGVAFVHGAAENPSVLGKDALDIGLLHHRCVQVADKHPGVDGFGVCLVRHVTGLDLQRHAGELVDGQTAVRVRERRGDDGICGGQKTTESWWVSTVNQRLSNTHKPKRLYKPVVTLVEKLTFFSSGECGCEVKYQLSFKMSRHFSQNKKTKTYFVLLRREQVHMFSFYFLTFCRMLHLCC